MLHQTRAGSRAFGSDGVMTVATAAAAVHADQAIAVTVVAV